MTTIEARITKALTEHWSASTHTDKKPFVDRCDGCGEVILTWGGEGDAYGVDGSTRLAAHQAAVVAGIVAEAWDEGCTTGNAHNGRRDANPYRRPE